MTISTKLTRAPRALLMATALATSSLVAFTPMAQAVQPGGYADLVEQVAPSVVFIEVQGTAKPANLDSDQMDEFRKFFGERFGAQPNMPAPGQRGDRARNGVGSGFIVSEDGQIVTNNHVVDGAQTVTVKLPDGKSFEAEVIGTDPATDLALLKINADEPLPAIAFGDSTAMRAGDEVVAVGNPFGLGGTVTSGIVSATSRDINSGPFDDFIQTDVAINRGNSGGPLFNLSGEVIGVNTAIFSPDGGSVGIGFAVPSNLAQDVISDLADDGMIERGWLGVQIRPMSDEVADVLGLDKPMGAVIEMVSEGSPAEDAGLKKGDIITVFGDTEIEELRDLPRAVASMDPESDAEVTVMRKGETLTLDVKVGTLPAQDA